MNPIKILMIGPSGVGKTTLKKIFFDQESPILLIEKTLEPTYGIETQTYNFGTTVYIHELAGQQLNEWLTTSTEIFQDADLIIIILDSREPWETNQDLWTKIEKLRQSLCPKAYIGVLFHKSDLLTSDDRADLSKKMSTEFAPKIEMAAFLSSISKEFFFETLKGFVAVLKKTLLHFENNNVKNLFIKMDLLSQFIDKNNQNIGELMKSSNLSIEYLQKYLTELQAEGYILIKDAFSSVELSQRGLKIVDDLKKDVYIKVQKELLEEYEMINALILSDLNGRPFFFFENKPDFIKSLVADGQMNSDPVLITMFFSAIKNFGQTMNQKGFTNIHLFGEKNQIICIDFDQIFGIFFIDKLNGDDIVISLFHNFTKDVYQKFAGEIEKFMKLGRLNNFNAIQDDIIIKIKNLNEALQKVEAIQQKIPKEELSKMIKQIENRDFQNINIPYFVQILVQYILREQPSLIKELSQFIIFPYL